MGTKENPGKYDCYDKALPDEPMFTLLARDPYMPKLLRKWAKRRTKDIKAGTRPESDKEMVEEAYFTSIDATIWRKNNDRKWRK
jgi:hypothetical protein